MKKLFIITALLFSSLAFANETPEYVYICMGSSSVSYHKTNDCKGLSNCSKEIKKVTESEAKELKRRQCKICYKQQARLYSKYIDNLFL